MDYTTVETEIDSFGINILPSLKDLYDILQIFQEKPIKVLELLYANSGMRIGTEPPLTSQEIRLIQLFLEKLFHKPVNILELTKYIQIIDKPFLMNHETDTTD